jgi:hypothetical protein
MIERIREQLVARERGSDMKKLIVLGVVIIVAIAFYVPGLPELVRDWVTRVLSLVGLG